MFHESHKKVSALANAPVSHHRSTPPPELAHAYMFGRVEVGYFMWLMLSNDVDRFVQVCAGILVWVCIIATPIMFVEFTEPADVLLLALGSRGSGV